MAWVELGPGEGADLRGGGAERDCSGGSTGGPEGGREWTLSPEELS